MSLDTNIRIVGLEVLARRKIERRHLIYYLRVFGRRTNQLVGHAVNITTEGLMLISEQPVETNTIFQFRMDLPGEIKESKQIDFEARSVWCEKDTNPDFYNTGLQLTKVLLKDIQIIELLINDFGKNSQ